MTRVANRAGAVGVAIALLGLVCGVAHGSFAEPLDVTLASTTSTENSGLYAKILPLFTAKTGIPVRVVAVGTGQALRIGRNGDADVVLVHDRRSEDAFVAEGWSQRRVDIMYNDFLLVGPRSDPAGIMGSMEVATALAKIADGAVTFLSRGDDSGTHKAELRLWKLAQRDPRPDSGRWYRETGSGMGATLNTASAMNAYTLVDRGTWLSFRNRGELVVVVQGDPPLRNPYGAMLVSPERHAHVNAEGGRALIEWLISDEGQRAIGSFRINGEELFYPNAEAIAGP